MASVVENRTIRCVILTKRHERPGMRLTSVPKSHRTRHLLRKRCSSDHIHDGCSIVSLAYSFLLHHDSCKSNAEVRSHFNKTLVFERYRWFTCKTIGVYGKPQADDMSSTNPSERVAFEPGHAIVGPLSTSFVYFDVIFDSRRHLTIATVSNIERGSIIAATRSGFSIRLYLSSKSWTLSRNVLGFEPVRIGYCSPLSVPWVTFRASLPNLRLRATTAKRRRPPKIRRPAPLPWVGSPLSWGPE